MTIEDLVRHTLDEQTTAVTPPRPDPKVLVGRGRRRGALTMAGAGLGVAGLMVGGLVGVAAIRDIGGSTPASNRSTHGTDNPPRATDGPQDLYLYDDGRIAFNGEEFPAVDGTGFHVAPNGLQYVDKDGRAHLIGLDGIDVQLSPDTPTKPGASYGDWASADSSQPLVAWTEVTETGAGAQRGQRRPGHVRHRADA